MPRPLVTCRVVGKDMQVQPLGIHPSNRVFSRGQLGEVPGWGDDRTSSRRRCPPGQVPVGPADGMQVVVEESAESCLALGDRVGGGHGSGMLADEIVQSVAPPREFDEEVRVIQRFEVPSGGREIRAVKSRDSECIDVGAWVQAQAAEKSLLVYRKILIGQIECRRHGQVFRLH